MLRPLSTPRSDPTPAAVLRRLPIAPPGVLTASIAEFVVAQGGVRLLDAIRAIGRGDATEHRGKIRCQFAVVRNARAEERNRRDT
jgi:hypothetical protein